MGGAAKKKPPLRVAPTYVRRSGFIGFKQSNRPPYDFLTKIAQESHRIYSVDELCSNFSTRQFCGNISFPRK